MFFEDVGMQVDNRKCLGKISCLTADLPLAGCDSTKTLFTLAVQGSFELIYCGN